MARKTSADRVISTVDTHARHGHKSRHRRFDRYKARLSIDPDSELIDEVTATAANVPDRDAEVACSPGTPARTSPRWSAIRLTGTRRPGRAWKSKGSPSPRNARPQRGHCPAVRWNNQVAGVEAVRPSRCGYPVAELATAHVFLHLARHQRHSETVQIDRLVAQFRAGVVRVDKG